VEQVLLEAWKQMKDEDDEASFHVIVVDSGPLFEGEFLASFFQYAMCQDLTPSQQLCHQERPF
jgi:hypothetical protein